jgi:hypothetical protein
MTAGCNQLCINTFDPHIGWMSWSGLAQTIGFS